MALHLERVRAERNEAERSFMLCLDVSGDEKPIEVIFQFPDSLLANPYKSGIPVTVWLPSHAVLVPTDVLRAWAYHVVQALNPTPRTLQQFDAPTDAKSRRARFLQWLARLLRVTQPRRLTKESVRPLVRALEAIASEDNRYLGHGDYETEPAYSAEKAMFLARRTLSDFYYKD